jgi:hypothetical protein
MKKTRRYTLSIVATLLVVGIFAWYIIQNWSQFQSISLESPWLLLVAAGLISINLYSFGKLFELAIEPHGVKLNRSEIYGLSVLTRFSKQISPAYIGATIRAVYLKKNYNVSYAKFSSSFLLSNVLQLIISGTLALAIYAFHENTLFNSRPIIAILVVVLLFLMLIYGPLTFFISALKRKTSNHKSKVLERLVAASEHYNKLRSHPKLLMRVFTWMLSTLAVSSATLFALYQSIGVDINVVSVVFISTLLSWSMVFSITPAGIGVREGLMALGAGLMGVPIPQTIAVSLLLRFITFIVVGLLSAYYAPKLFNTTLVNIKNVSRSA